MLSTYITAFLMLVASQASLYASSIMHADTCTANDVCENAHFISTLAADSGFVCMQGCTNGALGESYALSCEFEIYPTVWYSIETDSFAQFLNIQLRSDEMKTPVISVYTPVTGCADRQRVEVCNKGSHGEIDVLGVPVSPLSTYFIAVTAFYADTGQFELCLNTLSQSNICTIRRGIDVIARSEGGALTGPFLPGETVRICLTVDSFSAASNGCQWFQGLVPAFGNGWSPASFDSLGQPANATINGIPISVLGNGLYDIGPNRDSASWEWFTDVDYHWNRPFYKLGDFDGNNTVELCNTRFDAYCESDHGLFKDACCRPCWDDTTGTLLPGGWFAYGINGSCALKGPPVKHDWGDGNSCGGGMGPWRFCFDLQIRENSTCGSDSATDDLTLALFTFADGEIGSWTGNSSICAFDQPEKTRLPLLCAPYKKLGDEVLANICEGINLHYFLDHPDVIHWTWQASPADIIQAVRYESGNGEFIEDAYQIDVDTPVQVRYTFIGEQLNTDTLLIKNVSFFVIPQIHIALPEFIFICKKETRPLIIRPVISGGDVATMDFAWHPIQGDADTIVIHPPFHESTLFFSVSDVAGCHGEDTLQIKIRPCLGGPEPPTESNDPPTPQDPRPPGGYITEEQEVLHFRTNEAVDFTIHPMPAQDRIIITLNQPMHDADKMSISDLNGSEVMRISKGNFSGSQSAIDISALPDGIYTLTLHSQQSLVSQRLVKM